jgi:hypothetical protein
VSVSCGASTGFSLRGSRFLEIPGFTLGRATWNLPASTLQVPQPLSGSQGITVTGHCLPQVVIGGFCHRRQSSGVALVPGCSSQSLLTWLSSGRPGPWVPWILSSLIRSCLCEPGKGSVYGKLLTLRPSAPFLVPSPFWDTDVK